MIYFIIIDFPNDPKFGCYAGKFRYMESVTLTFGWPHLTVYEDSVTTEEVGQLMGGN